MTHIQSLKAAKNPSNKSCKTVFEGIYVPEHLKNSEFTADYQLIHHLVVFLFISVKNEEKCPEEPQIDRSVNQTLMIEDWRPTVRLLMLCLDQSEFRLIWPSITMTGRPKSWKNFCGQTKVKLFDLEVATPSDLDDFIGHFKEPVMLVTVMSVT